jgi:hypothetical protein
MTPSPEVETVQKAATAARLLSYIKENRVEMIGFVILAHLLGVSDRLLGQLSGVCF